MKKKISIIALMLVLVLSLTALVACSEAKVTSITVVRDSIATTVKQNETLDTSKAKVEAKYSDGTKAEITADKLTFGTIDTSTIGNKTLTISFGGQTVNHIVEVLPIELDTTAYVNTLTSQLLTDHEANSDEQSNKREEFYYRDAPLYVGDDNYFHFRATAQAIDDEGNPIEYALSQISTTITIAHKVSGEYVAIEEANWADYVTVDKTNVKLLFNEDAIGEQFKITVTADDVAEGASANDCTFTAEVTVTDGYNVYHAYELAIYDTRNAYGHIGDIWTEFKEEKGLTDVTANYLILQDDIKITSDDLADGFFWDKDADGANFTTAEALTDQELQGSLKDMGASGIYNKDVTSDELFGIEGNYFAIDASQLPLMVVDSGLKEGVIVGDKDDASDDKMMTTHTSLFYNRYWRTYTESGSNGVNPYDDGAQCDWTNLTFIGNGANNGKPEQSGATMLLKNSTLNFTATNVITKNFYIAYLFNRIWENYEYDNCEVFILDKCKVYDSYQSMIYATGAQDIRIIDSELIGCGGPAIIGEELKKSSLGGIYGDWSTHVNVINSTVESLINGNEPWFATYKVTSLVLQLKTAQALFDGTNGKLPATDKALVNANGELNAKVAFKESSTLTLAPSRLRCTYTEFATMEEYYTQYGLNGYTQEQKVWSLDCAGTIANKAYSTLGNDSTNPTQNVTFFESAATGGYINSIGTDTSVLAGIPYAAGDVLNVYLPLGVGVALGLFDAE